MGKLDVKVVMSVLLLLAFLLLVAVIATSQSSRTLSMRPFLREGDVFSHKRALLTTRNAPIGFPPPPAMTSPPPRGY